MDTLAMVEQKLDYIHHNPVKGRWLLVEDFALYTHSSAGFYELGHSNDRVVHYKALDVVVDHASKSSESSASDSERE